MKRLAFITLIIFLGLIMHANEIYSQSKSKTTEKRQVPVSLEFSVDNRTGATVIYTKPNRSLTRPEIQMIAKITSLDSINSYRFRIEVFTQRKVFNSAKVFIKSSFGIHEYGVEKDNDNIGSIVVAEFTDWGACYQYGCTAEGYIYTCILESSKEDFVKIISSDDIKVILSNMGNLDEHIANSDISKMNDLYNYLKAAQNTDLPNL